MSNCENKETVSDLWTSILLNAKKMRELDPNFDGLSFWRSIKGFLRSKSSLEILSWKNIDQKYYGTTMSLPEYYIDGYGNKKIIEGNHFLIQIVRIPTTEQPSIRKIMQLAFNIGQSLGYNPQKIIKHQSIEDYVNIDTNMTLSTILDVNDIASLKEKLNM